MPTVDQRLTDLGIVLPGPYPPHEPLDAVGVAALPRGGAVEIEVEVALRR